MYIQCLAAALLVVAVFAADPNTECGVSSNSPMKVDNGRIVGGVPAPEKGWPWIAAICQGDARSPANLFQYCGGTLISDRHILTAGHCVDGTSDDEIKQGHVVVLGTNRYKSASPQNIYRITRIVRHAQYNQGAQVNNDIAILILDRPVTYSDSVRRICLAGPHMRVEEVQAKRSNPGNLKLEKDGMVRGIVGGWGATKEDGATSQVLLQTSVPIWPAPLCEKTMAAINMKKTNMMICAGYLEGAKDSCQGDSGGPLIVRSADSTSDTGERFYLVGDVSFGSGCARAQSPGIYGHIGNFIPWIKQVLATYPK